VTVPRKLGPDGCARLLRQPPESVDRDTGVVPPPARLLSGLDLGGLLLLLQLQLPLPGRLLPIRRQHEGTSRHAGGWRLLLLLVLALGLGLAL
jgi:hypothetical protein